MPIKLARNLTLPNDAITQTFGFFGRKGSGKTYAAGKLAEQFLASKSQVVVLDPVGNWYGLRLDRTGKKPSRFEIPILGGEHGDVPLQPGAGGVVADFVVSTGSSCILDVSLFRKNQRKEFVTDFAEEVFYRKKTSRTPMHFVVEEAQVFAPQRTFKGEERMLGALEDIVRLGRNYGIGSSLISQRPQSINTELRNQCEPLVVLQLVAKHERRAVEQWMEHMGVDADLEQLARMQTGDCFFWSPAWLDRFIRTRFATKTTFDASATPEIGTKQHSPEKLRPVDLEALQSSMSEVIEKQKENDPKHLKKQVADLKRQLASQKPEVDQEAIDRAVQTAVADRDRHWESEIGKLTRSLEGMRGRLHQIGELAHLNGDADATVSTPPAPTPAARRPSAPRRQPRPQVGSAPQPVEGDWFRPAHQRILNALAWLETMGMDQPSRSITAAVAGVSPKSSSFKNDIGRLSTNGMIEYPGPGLMRLADQGRAVAEQPDSPPSIEELHEAWRRCPAFRPAHVRLIDALIDHYPRELTREELAEAAGVSPNSSSFKNDLGRLSAMGLARYPARGTVLAGELLFPHEMTT